MNTRFGTAAIMMLVLASAFTGCAAQHAPSASRVKQQQTPLAITNVENGRKYSGALPLQVRLASNRHEYGDIKLLIDGAEVGEAGDNIQPSADGFTTIIPVETDTYSNGWHDMTVQSDDQPQTRYRVKFWNNVSEFSITDAVAAPGGRIRAKSVTGGPWTVKLWAVLAATDTHDPLVRVFRGQGKTIDVLWDCKDSQGKTVPEDGYAITLVTGKTPPLRSFINKMY